MSKNVIVNGTTYNGVNSVKLSQEGGGYATFTDASGSSAEWEELYSITISDPIHLIAIDWNSDWNNYKAFFADFSNITLSASDFLRLQLNDTAAAGSNGSYPAGNSKFTTLDSSKVSLGYRYNNTYYYSFSTNSILGSGVLTKINIFAYASDTNITGGTIKIYGLK